MRQYNPAVKLILISLLFAGLTGCSTLGSMTNRKLPNELAATPQNAYQVEMHSNFGEPKVFVGKHDESLTVQDALQAAGATKKYRRMNVDVYRQVPGKIGGLKMPVEYRTATKTVRPEQNYAIHPGDRIVIRPNTETTIERLVDSVM